MSRRAVDPAVAPETGRGKLSLLWFAPVALAVACVPQNAGYEDVRTMVATTGHDVRWNHVDARDTTKEVRAILSEPLTADGAVKVALLNNADLQATFEELGIARGELIRALRLPNPTAEGGLQYAEGESPDIELSISQDLSELILLPLRSDAAEAEFAAAKLDVAGRVMDLVLEVRKGFYDYIADQQILELRKTVLEALRASAVAAEQIHAAGNMTDLDLASQQVLYEEARVSFSSAEAALATSRERLNALLGLWGPATRWQATGRLPDPVEESMESPEARAVSRSVELATLRQRFIAASERATLARTRGLLPELKAGVAFEREGDEWSRGPIAEIELPIFYQGQGEVARAQAEMRREQQRLGATAVRVRAALRAVHVRATTARQRAQYFKDVLLPMRERIVNDTQLQFNAMNTSVFQLLIARRDQIEAGRAYIDALREYWLAKADLEQLLAGRIPGGAMAGPTTSVATAGTAERGGH